MSKHDKFMNLDTIGESIGDFARGPAQPRTSPRGLPADQVGKERARNVWTIDRERIIPDPDQPRKEFDPEALERLAASLRDKGQLQPIQVRWDEGAERFVVLVGERRWRAAGLAGLAKLQCIVRDADLSDEERLSIQLVENCLREDLSPMEQARAFRSLMDRQGWTQEKLAEELAVSRPVVVKALSLLKLPGPIQEQVEAGALSPSHAHEIVKIEDPAAQIRLAATVVEQGLTRDDVARQVKGAPRRKPAAKKAQTVAVLRLGGYRIEITRKAGIEPSSAAAALREAAEKYEAAEGRGGADQAA